MLKQLKEENKELVSEWAIIREKGFLHYLLTKTIALGIMMALIFVANIFLCKEVNYTMIVIVYIVLTIITPILSWNINEFRYRKSKK